MNISCRIVSFSTPWIFDRLPSIQDWWGEKITFQWQDAHLNTNEKIEMIPWGESLSILSDTHMNLWLNPQKELTIIAAPYPNSPMDYLRRVFLNRAAVRGICFHKYTRPDGHGAGLIQVLANEFEHSYVNGKDLGDTFSLYLQHELCHFLAFKLKISDETHQWFYSGQPEKARDEILAAL